MSGRGLLIALLFLTVSPQTQPRLPIHIESLVYPVVAYQAHISGEVVVMAQIDSEGRVQVPVRPPGHPMLVQAAEENMRTWRFQKGPGSELRVTYRFSLEGEPKFDYPSSICKFDLPDSVTIVTPPPKPEINFGGVAR
jgi:TonB family protein